MKLSPRLLWICCFLLLATCRNAGNTEGKVTIATSANMQYAMKALAKRFTDNTGIPCELIVNSSGKLTAQIREGAPYDIFVAANMQYPMEIDRQGLAEAPPALYAEGQLVLWTIREGVEPSVEALASDEVAHIALANPRTAPYGKAALESLRHQNLLPVVSDKLVYGESISQTNQFILSGSAEMGFTAMAVVLSPQMKGKGRWILIPREWHSPIEQGVVLLKKEKGPGKGAAMFYDFLLSQEAGEILVNYGYSVDE